MEIIKLQGLIPIKELATILHVSEMTIRRDLKYLEDSSNLEYLDLAMSLPLPNTVTNFNIEYNLLHAEDKQNSQKIAIGKFAASLIDNNDVIILDTGTTTEQLAPYLPTDKNITVLCYNLNILMHIHTNPGINIMFAGGYYHPNTQLFECSESIDFIHNVRAHKVFISAAGIHQDLGITCIESYEVPTKRAIITSALEKILLVDSSKFNLIRPSYFCNLNEITSVVTDTGISEDWIQILKESDIKLYIV